MKNSILKDALKAEALVKMALEEDLGAGSDITSQATLPLSTRLRGRIVAKEQGIIAGLPLVEAVFHEVDPTIEVRPVIMDGDPVRPGTLACEITGTGQSVLTGERTALNFLRHLSGIATLTHQFVQAVTGTKAVILDTRKTTPGWRLLEKYAVKVGGGQNHRMGLYDMVMIKDNHIDGAGGIEAAVSAVRANPDCAGIPIEVEVRTLDELREVLPLNVNRVLLDNMSDDQMREAVLLTDGRVPLEASGNMTLDRVASVAATGVDFISVGALTHSFSALDLSMKITRL